MRAKKSDRFVGFLYARAMRESGVDVEYKNYEGGFHAMLNLHHILPLAQEMLDDAVVFIHKHTGASLIVTVPPMSR